MRLLRPVLLSACIVVAASPLAQAQGFHADIVKLLNRPSLPHPLAEHDGRIPLRVLYDETLDPAREHVLALAPGLGSVRLLPSQVEAFRAAHPRLTLSYSPPLRPQLDVATARTHARVYRETTGADGSGVVIGIIDTGLDVAHPDLRDANGHTRVAWLLDLSRPPAELHPELEQAYGCTDSDKGGPCAVFAGEDIDASIAGQSSAAPRDLIGHGTHVASIAAGNGLSTPGQQFAGMAPGATIIAARVTRGGGEDMSENDVLLATRFIFERAEGMKPKSMPAVVNLSLGGDFGPHDGSTPLEKGLASFVGWDHPGRAIVVAAGNSGTLHLLDSYSLGIHTEARVAPGVTVRVPTRSPLQSKPTVRGAVYIWIGHRPNDNLSIGIEGPLDEVWLKPIPPRTQSGFTSKDGRVKGAIINNVEGGSSPLSGDASGAAIAFSGEWPSDQDISVLIEGSGTADLWLQGLDDASPSSAGIGHVFLRAVKHGTVNIPATHPNIIAVGANLNRVQWETVQGGTIELPRYYAQSPRVQDAMCYFSGAGPAATGIAKPDITAPGAMVIGAMSQDARPMANPQSMFATSDSECPSATTDCFVIDDYHAVASGTSMAAPMVAGAVALLLARNPGLTQPELLALLQAGARRPSSASPYPFQMGPGVLDMEGARQAYEAMGRPLNNREPDPQASWVVLAAPYARPDPTWTLQGTLETRVADGTIADGFDDRALALQTENALVLEPITRIAPGLWRFSVSAPGDRGGQTMRIEVQYKGQRIGERIVLPIGVDMFAATQGLVAEGGCSVGRVSGGQSQSRFHALSFFLLFTLLRRIRKTPRVTRKTARRECLSN